MTLPSRSALRYSLTLRAAAAALCLWGFPATPLQAQNSDVIDRGKVLFAAGGCANCHTDTKAKGPLAAGGAALKTPFGDFFAPNITPDKTHGIGTWSDLDFIRAMRDGIAPDGSHYFPVFPYTSFTYMTDVDLKALKAFIFTLPPVAQANRPHDVAFPFSVRFGQVFWKWLFFDRGPYRPDPEKSAEWNRGAYLSLAVSHCGECHTPRNFLGGLDKSRWFIGAAEGEGPEGEGVPNIRSDHPNGIRSWTQEQIETYLESGEDPEGDYAGSLMFDVVDDGTDQLSSADRAAIATYLKALPPIR